MQGKALPCRFDRPGALLYDSPMETLLLILAALAVTTLGTLVGLGGGFIFVPLMIFLLPERTPADLTYLSLVMVMFNAWSATHRYSRMGRVDFRTGWIFGVATVIPAILGVFLVARMKMDSYAPVFGGVLIAAAGLLVFRQLAPAGVTPGAGEGLGAQRTVRRLTDADGVVYEYAFNLPLGTALSSGVGFISSFFGVGGGIVHVPLMTQALRFPVHVATATSMFVLAISATVGVMTHLLHGERGVGLATAAAVGVGGLIGGQIGALLSRRMKGRTILFLLAAAMCVVGVRLVARVVLS